MPPDEKSLLDDMGSLEHLYHLGLEEFLSSDEARKYAGRWVGVLDSPGSNEQGFDNPKRQIAITGDSPEPVRDLMRKDYEKELGGGSFFSVAYIPEGSGELEVAILGAGLKKAEGEWLLEPAHS